MNSPLKQNFLNLFHIYLSINTEQVNGKGTHYLEVKTLERFFENNGTLGDTNKIDVLKQLIQCLVRIHQQRITFPQLSFSRKLPSNADQLPSIAFPDDDEVNRRSDILNLASIYCYVLTNKIRSYYTGQMTAEDIQCSDPEIALDILKVMTNEDITPTIEDVIGHPFHWNDFTKVYFICSAFEYIKSMNEKSIRDKIDEADNVIPGKDWITDLTLRQDEIRRIKETPNNSISIGDKVIINIFFRKFKDLQEGNDDERAAERNKMKKSVYELMRFFRNRYIHHLEDKDDIKLAFGGYPSEYLKFFTSRFPNFFMHVYLNMREYLCSKDNRNEFFFN